MARSRVIGNALHIYSNPAICAIVTLSIDSAERV